MDPRNLGPEHRVVIRYIPAGKLATETDDSKEIVVVSHVPDEVNLSTAANWDRPLGGIEKYVGQLNAWGSSTAGIALADPITTALAYMGSDNPSMTINLEFNADKNALNDVVKPLVDLTKMTVPAKLAIGLIEFPGPTIGSEILARFKGFMDGSSNTQTTSGNQTGGGDANGNTDRDGNANASSPKISIMIGRVMYIPSIVIDGLNIMLSTQVDDTLRPIYGRATVRFKRFMSPLRSDIEETFLMGGGSGN